MKKALVVLLALAFVASGFAQPVADVGVYEFWGWQKVTWGVDLNKDNATGFKNDAQITFNVNFFGAFSAATEGDGVWGELVLKTNDDGRALFAENGEIKKTDVVVDKAVLHFGSFWLGVKGAGAMAQGEWDDTMPSAWNLWHWEGDYRLLLAGTGRGNGISFGYDSDMFGFAGTLGTSDQYTSDYGVSLSPFVNVAGAHIRLGVSYVLAEGDNPAEKGDLGLAFRAKYRVDLNDSMFLEPLVTWAATNNLDSEDDFDKGAVKGSVLFGWGGTVWDTNWNYYLFDFNNYTPGVSVHVYHNLEVEKSTEIALRLETGDLAGFSAAAEFKTGVVEDSWNLTGGLKYTIDLDGIAVTPKASVKMNSATTELMAGVVLGGLVSNTTFEANYHSTDLENDKGKIALSCQISL
jgi:hypothetical protein